jgi:hypothetical protein
METSDILLGRWSTPEGIERIRRAVTKHGRHSKQARAEREQYRTLLRQCRDVLAAI